MEHEGEQAPVGPDSDSADRTALAAGEHGDHSTDSGWMALMETTTELSSGSYYLSGNVAYRGVAPSPSAAMLPSASTAMSST